MVYTPNRMAKEESRVGVSEDIIGVIKQLTEPIPMTPESRKIIAEKKEQLYLVLTDPSFVQRFGYDYTAKEPIERIFEYDSPDDEFVLVSDEKGIWIGFETSDIQPWETMLGNALGRAQEQMFVRGTDGNGLEICMLQIPRDRFSEDSLFPAERMVELITHLSGLIEPDMQIEDSLYNRNGAVTIY